MCVNSLSTTEKCRFMDKRVREISRIFVREFALAVWRVSRTLLSRNTSTSVYYSLKIIQRFNSASYWELGASLRLAFLQIEGRDREKDGREIQAATIFFAPPPSVPPSSCIFFTGSNLQCSCSGWPTGYGKKLSSSQAQLGQATCLAVA